MDHGEEKEDEKRDGETGPLRSGGSHEQGCAEGNGSEAREGQPIGIREGGSGEVDRKSRVGVVDHVYFQDFGGRGESIYVGYSGTKTRKGSHRRNGHVFLAALPASEDYEKHIHRHFAQWLVPNLNQSTFKCPEIWDYVAWLCAHGYATDEMDRLIEVPPLPWEIIDPAKVEPYWDDGKQRSLFQLSPRERIAQKAKQNYLSSLSDEWYTPSDLIEAARSTMGGIDLDPASNSIANATVKATHFYSKRINGLQQPWRGRVWMNPPYGDLGPQFAEKLVAEINVGRVTQACALMNLNSMSSLWFLPLFQADALIVSRGRWNFVPGSPAQPNEASTTGNVVLYFGPHRLTFAENFRPYGSVLYTG